jgi:hypothetical protein
MTNSSWEHASLQQVLRQLRGRLSPRQARLAACALVRRLPPATRGSSGEAIELAERFADRKATAHELANARFGGRFQPGHAAWAVCWSPAEDPWPMLERALAWVTGFLGGSAQLADFRHATDRGEEKAQADLLREVAGDPSRPVVIDPAWTAWNDGTVARLARSIYEERAFEQMPILGDALEEAGCADGAVLEHCRAAGGHVRGCWVLDRVLGLG